MSDFTNKGLFRANPYASIENNLRNVDPDAPGTSQQDQATDIDTVTGSPVAFTGIKYQSQLDGSATLYEFPDPVPVTDYSGLRDAIHEIVRKYEVDSVVTVSFSTPDVTVTHHGAGTLSAVQVDGSDAGTFARTTP